MPEKGRAILTAREDTAKRITEQAHAKGFTVDEFINQLMRPAGKAGWPICDLCGAKVESRNVREHRAEVPPDRVLGTVDTSNGYVVLN